MINNIIIFIILLLISIKSGKKKFEFNTISTSLCPLGIMQYFHSLYPYYAKVGSLKSHYQTFVEARYNTVVMS